MGKFLLNFEANVIKLVILIATVAGILYGVYYAGGKHVQDKWDLANIETEKEIKELKDKAAKATGTIIIKYVDRDKIIYKKGETITKYVDRAITSADDSKCVIPKKFILLHDAAAKNIVPPEIEEVK